MTVAYESSKQFSGRDIETAEYDLSEQDAGLFRSMLDLREKAIASERECLREEEDSRYESGVLATAEHMICRFIEEFAVGSEAIGNDWPSWATFEFEGVLYSAHNVDGRGLQLSIEPA